MTFKNVKRMTGLAGLVVVSALALAPCGGASSAGGAATGKDFSAMTIGERHTATTDLATQASEDLDDVTTEEIDMGNEFMESMCEMVTDENIKLKDIDENSLDLPDLDDLDLEGLDLEGLEGLDYATKSQ